MQESNQEKECRTLASPSWRKWKRCEEEPHWCVCVWEREGVLLGVNARGSEWSLYRVVWRNRCGNQCAGVKGGV